MSAKPTPGPWRVMEQSWSNSAVIAGEECICALDINHATEDTQEALEAVMAANARLIAAAPDLAAALRGLMELTKPMFVVQTPDGVVTHPAYAAGLAALAKVEGEQSHE